MYKHKIVNTITGEEIIEPLSELEIKQIESNIAKANEEIAEAEQKAAAKAAAEAKLAALGLDADDLKALGL